MSAFAGAGNRSVVKVTAAFTTAVTAAAISAGTAIA
ncbi:hypothetical protein JOE66_000884 [Subtercola frigoramans]|uniref:Uncharacterized protein n=1 Tax=Subtercola frigoramans TaxID=120298 RepID=A0ABS2L2D3_9MICO|nr:hypothetical protein [Subtercola frigoramans]